jgi:hypothetical protein
VCVCILALVIGHANRVFSAPHYIVICGLFGSTIFFHKQHNFRKKFIEYKRRGYIFSATLSETFLILILIQRDIIINVDRSHYSRQILIESEFSGQIFEKSSI